VTEHPFRARGPIGTDEALTLLLAAELEVLGRMPWSSNATFLVDLCAPGGEVAPGAGEPRAQAVYKPARGERPLWDFPTGLYRREVAAFVLADHLGWDLVPPTVERDGPLGPGSVQLFVPARFEEHYFTFRDDERFGDALRRLCAFDIVSNNTDRKSGHCLLGEDDRVWAIDNGLSFHAQFKLRTVIWDFGGEPLPEGVAADLARLLDEGLPDSLTGLLDPFERDAILTRAGALASAGCFPVDDGGHRYPWPLV
jgi:uncharacterized repeat protein (TIGR03843 family)